MRPAEVRMAVLLDQAWVKVQAKTFTKWSVAKSRLDNKTLYMYTDARIYTGSITNLPRETYK